MAVTVAGADVVRAARELAPLARETAAVAERERRLDGELVAGLRDAGLLRLGVPAALGGPEAAPLDALRAVREVGRGDGSAGWFVAIIATTSPLASHLPEAGAREVFGDPRSVACGVWAPRGRASQTGDELRVDGRWAMCSGVEHADWMLGGCLDGERMVVAALPTCELEVVDTWDVAGLRATGSHDVVATGVAAPARRFTTSADGSAPTADTPLARFPLFGYFAQTIASAALGIARGAIDDFVGLAAAKTTQGSARTLAERSTVQARLAAADAALRAAEAGCDAATAAAWDTAPTLAHRLGLRLAATHAARTAAAVTRDVHELGGAAAIYASSPLQRRLRDAETITAHVMVAPASLELCGRLMLGQTTSTAQL